MLIQFLFLTGVDIKYQMYCKASTLPLQLVSEVFPESRASTRCFKLIAG